MALTPKQQRFVEEYLVSLNATKAAINAGYSEKTARQMGHKLLVNPLVEEAIRNGINKRSIRTLITQDYVLEKLKEIADTPAGDYEGSALKFGNKIRVLELLAKHTDLLNQKSGASGPNRGDDPLTASLKEWIKQHGN